MVLLPPVIPKKTANFPEKSLFIKVHGLMGVGLLFTQALFSQIIPTAPNLPDDTNLDLVVPVEIKAMEDTGGFSLTEDPPGFGLTAPLMPTEFSLEAPLSVVSPGPLNPAEHLERLGKYCEPNWRALCVIPKMEPTIDRDKIAYRLGVNLATSYLSTLAGDMRLVINLTQDLSADATALGLGEEWAMWSRKEVMLASEKKQAELLKSQSEVMSKIQKVLDRHADLEVATLIEVGYWTKIMSATSHVVAVKLTTETSEPLDFSVADVVNAQEVFRRLSYIWAKSERAKSEISRKNSVYWGPMGEILRDLNSRWTQRGKNAGIEDVVYTRMCLESFLAKFDAKK